MSQVAVAHPGVEPAESPLTPESWGKLGMWIFLAGDAMSFGGLLAGYGALRIGSADWPVPSEVLGVGLTAFMTFLLICSSVTMVKALAAVKRGDLRGLRNFLLLTILGGLIFLGLQAYEWTHLITEVLPPKGLTFTRHLFGTTFFILTGFHGMHVTGGVIYLSCIVAQGVRGKYSRDRWEAVEIVGLYWHFVDLVWILIFTFVYLL
ncbi:MAG: cytochrome c oxidase subunit 3 [candidate division NC10 bacterium]|nr:cytochrome c oxidase subunit 3 [candidate division NC10 bacterium]